MKTLVFKSYNKNMLTFYTQYLEVLFVNRGYKYSFFSKISDTNKITLLKSPHVYKKFKEHYIQKECTTVLKLYIDEKHLLSILPILHINRNFISLSIS